MLLLQLRNRLRNLPIEFFPYKNHTAMNSRVIIHCLLLLLYGVVSCAPDRPVIPTEVQAVDSLIARNPRAALTRISRLEERYEMASDAIRMRLALKKIKARDKAFIPHHSDDTICAIIDYYDAHGTLAERMEAYHYGGSVYRDLRDYPRALEWYNKVIDLAASEENPNDEILLLAYSQMSDVYGMQNKPREALDALSASFKIAKKLGQADLVSRADLAWAYQINGETDSAYYYYKQVLDEISQRKAYKEYASYIATQLCFYEDFGDRFRKERDTCLNILRNIPREDLTEYGCTALSTSYERLGNLDSAMSFEKLALDGFLAAKDYLRARSTASNLYRLYKKKGDAAGSYAFAEIAITCADSLETQMQLKASECKDGFFRYKRDVDNERSLRSRNARLSFAVLGEAFGLFLLISVVIFCFVFYRKRIRELVENVNQLKLDNEGLKASTAHNKVLQALDDPNLFTFCEKLRLRIKNSKDLPITQAFMRNYLWPKVNAAFPDFQDNLYHAYPSIKLNEVYLAYLLRAGLRQAEIMILLDSSRSSISIRVKRLEERLGCKVSSL